MKINGKEIRGLLIDLDGVLYVGGEPVRGAVEVVKHLYETDFPVCFLTNTSTKSIDTLEESLSKMDFAVEAADILSAPEAAKVYLEQNEFRFCKFLLNEEVLQDFCDFNQGDEDVQAVVIGDIGNAWTYDLLNKVFQLVMDGAELIALHRNKFWETESGLQMDIGAFVAGIEYATGKSARIIGKPEPTFFQAALTRLGLAPEEVAMIGDDIDSDVGAAQQLGITGVLVRTGKYREAYVRESDVKPDSTIDSIKDILQQAA